MPEVQNVGAVDYAQYQPSQTQYEEYADNYNTQPQVYDEDAAEIKKASKSRLGATILTAAIIGGGMLWGGYALGKKGAKKELAELQNAAEKYKETIDKQAKEFEEQAKVLEKEADEVMNANIFHWKKGGKFAENVKVALKKLRETINGKKDEAKEGVEKTAEETKKAANEAKDTTSEAKKAADESN